MMTDARMHPPSLLLLALAVSQRHQIISLSLREEMVNI